MTNSQISAGSSDRRRLLILGLDGLEVFYARRLMDAGEMPALAALRDRSAAFLLDHGPAQRTGLALEHFASGLAPKEAERWSAVEFNPMTYEIWQEGARFKPFLEEMGLNVTVFDAPYIDLRHTGQMEGLVGWGAHDPGTATMGRPASLVEEFHDKFGDYPARRWLYATPCYSEKRCEQMGDELVKAVDLRCEAALWLRSKRPGSDVFFVTTGELHSAIEGLWHGIDSCHPMHEHPSAPAAADALLKVHRAVDRMIAALVETAGDAEVVAFSMGGMGTNLSDLQSMVLLPELLYRHAFGEPLLQVPAQWAENPQAVPQMSETQRWGQASEWFAAQKPSDAPRVTLLQKVKGKVSKAITRSALKTTLGKTASSKPRNEPAALPYNYAEEFEYYKNKVDWQPAVRYQPFWPMMKAFSLPSFYDGRIRINLIGREKQGIVRPEDYEKVCTEIETIIRGCKDPRTGESVVDKIERPSTSDPQQLDSSDADMVIVWNAPSAALEHPRYGLVGPVAYRRTGGHTGPYGIAYIASQNIQPDEYDVRSSFDLAPTVADLLKVSVQGSMSGESFLRDCLRSS